MRIDTHLHYWQPDCGFDNRPVADHEAYRRDFLPRDVAAELARSRIDGTVLVQTAPQVEETAWLVDLARGEPTVWGVTGWVDLDADAGATAIDALAREPVVVGVRAQLRRIADDRFILRPRVLANLGHALTLGLGVTVLAEPRHYPHLREALGALPPGPVVFNHLAMVTPRADRAAWVGALRTLAARPQTFVQLSGLPFLFGAAWRSADALSVLDTAYDILGARRLVFASDWPMLVRFARYGDWVGCVESLLARRGASEADTAAVFGGNALACLPRLSPRTLSNPRPRSQPATEERR
ncbi:MAG TPA: amidohydrolase family protein [Casimicrobiaceae bacterium]|nr:amidohydrolase family protein [Casimicrobiaceae bacterium]